MSAAAPRTSRPGLLDLVRQHGGTLFPRVQAGTAPAAGSDMTLTVPGGVVWELKSIICTFLSSAVAGNRQPNFEFFDGNLVFGKLPIIEQIPASTTSRWALMQHGAQYGTFSAASGRVLPLPTMLLLPSWQFRSNTFAIDAGDAWSAIAFYAVEYRPPLDVDVTQLAAEIE